ncbi:unnamed protein product, partial [Owenia fusiformis]
NMAAPMDDQNFVENQVIFFCNSEFGEDVKSLGKVRNFYTKALATKKSLEDQLSFVQTEAPTKLNKAVREAEEATTRISQLSKEQDVISVKVNEKVEEIEPVVKRITHLTSQINELEHYTNYLTCLSKVEELSSEIQSALIINSVQRSVDHFSEMVDLMTSLNDSKCANLKSFLRETVLFWYKILRDKLSGEFDEVLKALNWPFIVTTVKSLQQKESPEQLNVKLETLLIQLLEIQLPFEVCPEPRPQHPTLASLPDWRPLPLPMSIMVKPIKKRFRFHFYGKKQTNSIDKPEWFFTQVLSWIRDHTDFLVKKIQPVLDRSNYTHIDAKSEFSRAMVMLVMEKLVTDIPELMFDEHQFSHMVDEALLFDQELRGSYGYPSAFPGCLHVLTEEEPFKKWILVERKFALEKVDMMLTSNTAWEFQYKEVSDVDDMKVPECGESFVTLAHTITDRYKPLPYPHHKLRFLDVQLELFDDFRIRLLQVMKEEAHNPLGERFCAILNTVHYIAEVLTEWSDLLFFLQLQYHKTEEKKLHSNHDDSIATSTPVPSISSPTMPRLRSSISITESLRLDSPNASMEIDDPDDVIGSIEESVFDDILKLFQRMKDEMLANLIDYISTDVKSRSKPYRKDRWSVIPPSKEFSSLGLSNSACEMFLILKERLHDVKLLLTNPYEPVQ